MLQYEQLIESTNLGGEGFLLQAFALSGFNLSLLNQSISRSVKRFVDSDLCFKNLAADDDGPPASPTCQALPLLMGGLTLVPPGIPPLLCLIAFPKINLPH